MVLLAGAVWSSLLPIELGAAYAFFSAISCLAYFVDKLAAQRGTERVPEAGLHLIDLLCGWPGGLVAQGFFRHKVSKQSFQRVFWVIAAANVGAVAWFVTHAGA